LKRGGLARGKAFRSAKKKKREKRLETNSLCPDSALSVLSSCSSLFDERSTRSSRSTEREEKVGGREVSA